MITNNRWTAALGVAGIYRAGRIDRRRSCHCGQHAAPAFCAVSCSGSDARTERNRVISGGDRAPDNTVCGAHDNARRQRLPWQLRSPWLPRRSITHYSGGGPDPKPHTADTDSSDSGAGPRSDPGPAGADSCAYPGGAAQPAPTTGEHGRGHRQRKRSGSDTKRSRVCACSGGPAQPAPTTGEHRRRHRQRRRQFGSNGYPAGANPRSCSGCAEHPAPTIGKHCRRHRQRPTGFTPDGIEPVQRSASKLGCWWPCRGGCRRNRGGWCRSPARRIGSQCARTPGDPGRAREPRLAQPG